MSRRPGIPKSAAPTASTGPEPRPDQRAFDPAIEALILDATGAARVTSVELLQSLWSGYGSIVRVALDGAAFPSVIAKRVRWPTEARHPRGWATSRSHARKVRSYAVETRFYRDYAATCDAGCRVPRLLADARESDGVLLVLEDLDESGFHGRRVEVTFDEVKACLSWLACFHATFVGRRPDGLWETGTYWHLETRPDELAALGDTPLARAASALDRRLRESPFQTLVHGDAKLANFCFSDDGARVAAVDFQYVGGGPGIRDVAYFLGSCLDEEACARQQDALLDHYFDALAEALRLRSVRLDVAALTRDWRDLYPVAWTDFYRFLAGWSPKHWKIHAYTRRLARAVLGPNGNRHHDV